MVYEVRLPPTARLLTLRYMLLLYLNTVAEHSKFGIYELFMAEKIKNQL